MGLLGADGWVAMGLSSEAVWWEWTLGRRGPSRAQPQPRAAQGLLTTQPRGALVGIHWPSWMSLGMGQVVLGGPLDF